MVAVLGVLVEIVVFIVVVEETWEVVCCWRVFLVLGEFNDVSVVVTHLRDV